MLLSLLHLYGNGPEASLTVVLSGNKSKMKSTSVKMRSSIKNFEKNQLNLCLNQKQNRAFNDEKIEPNQVCGRSILSDLDNGLYKLI